MVSKTKIDESLGQFKNHGFNTSSHLDRNSSGGGIMFFVREDMPAKLIGSKKPPIKGFYVEMNLGKQNAVLMIPADL